MVRTPKKKAKMDTTKLADENKDGAREESNVQIEPGSKADETTNTNVNAKEEENTSAVEVGDTPQADISSIPVEDKEVTQHNQVAKVDTLLKNSLQKLFSTNVAVSDLLTYGILREGILRAGERVLQDFTGPCLTYEKGLLRSTGYQHTHSFKSAGGEDISSYAVIAEDVTTECVTADVVDGGIGMKHIKFLVKSHKEGPWKYRVVICGREA